jgi:hypothetical protein
MWKKVPGPLILVRINKELLERESSGSGLDNWDWRPWGSAMLTMRHPSICKSWRYNSPTNGGFSVNIVLLPTESHRVSFCLYIIVRSLWKWTFAYGTDAGMVISKGYPIARRNAMTVPLSTKPTWHDLGFNQSHHRAKLITICLSCGTDTLVVLDMYSIDIIMFF